MVFPPLSRIAAQLILLAFLVNIRFANGRHPTDLVWFVMLFDLPLACYRRVRKELNYG